MTFKECAEAYMAAHEPSWKNAKHRRCQQRQMAVRRSKAWTPSKLHFRADCLGQDRSFAKSEVAVSVSNVGVRLAFAIALSLRCAITAGGRTVVPLKEFRERSARLVANATCDFRDSLIARF